MASKLGTVTKTLRTRPPWSQVEFFDFIFFIVQVASKRGIVTKTRRTRATLCQANK
jgi:hypothetical protein